MNLESNSGCGTLKTFQINDLLHAGEHSSGLFHQQNSANSPVRINQQNCRFWKAEIKTENVVNMQQVGPHLWEEKQI